MAYGQFISFPVAFGWFHDVLASWMHGPHGCGRDCIAVEPTMSQSHLWKQFAAHSHSMGPRIPVLTHHLCDLGRQLYLQSFSFPSFSVSHVVCVCVHTHTSGATVLKYTNKIEWIPVGPSENMKPEMSFWLQPFLFNLTIKPHRRHWSWTSFFTLMDKVTSWADGRVSPTSLF